MKKILALFTAFLILLSFAACEAKDNTQSMSEQTDPPDHSAPSVKTIWADTAEEAAALLADEKAFWEHARPSNEEAETFYKEMRSSFLEDGFLYKPVYAKEYKPENSVKRYGLFCQGPAFSDDVLYDDTVSFHVRVVRLSPVNADYETIKEYCQVTDNVSGLVESSRKSDNPREQIYLKFMEPVSLLPYGMPGAIERICAYFFLDETHYVLIGMEVYPGKATEEMLLSFIDDLSFEKVMIPEVKPSDPPAIEFVP